MQQEIFFSLSGIKTQKIKTQESKERKFEEKFRKKGWANLICLLGQLQVALQTNKKGEGI